MPYYCKKLKRFGFFPSSYSCAKSIVKIQMRSMSIPDTKDLQQELQQLKSDKEELITQLEEAQFRVAEESINRADVEVRELTENLKLIANNAAILGIMVILYTHIIYDQNNKSFM